MNKTSQEFAAAGQDAFGRAVAARLSDATAELPHDVTERLRAARMQALARRRKLQPNAAVVAVGAATAALGQGDDDAPSFWHRMGAALPLLALVVGLIAIEVVQTERRASEVAEVDAALLTDALPPSAYTDPGFVQFLKSGR